MEMKFLFKLLYIIPLILFSGKVFAFGCTVDGGATIGSGNTNVVVNLNPTIDVGQNLVVDLSQHIYCNNSYGNWIDTDHINIEENSTFGGALTNLKGTMFWNNATYPFPLTTKTNVLDIGEITPIPLPLKLYLTPLGAAGGVLINTGDVIAYIHMYKIAELNGGDPRHFIWTVIAGNTVTMPTGGCNVENRNVIVDLQDYPSTADVPVRIYCSSNQRLSFSLTGTTTDSSRQIFANTSSDATKASGIGISLMRQGVTLATEDRIDLGEVSTSPVSLGLSATYAPTGGQITAGTVQSVIGVTFTYE